MTETILDLSGIENVYPPAPVVTESLVQVMLSGFADRTPANLRMALAGYTKLPVESIFVDAGEDALVKRLFSRLLSPGGAIAAPEPSLGTYRCWAEMAGIEVFDTGRADDFSILTEVIQTVADEPRLQLIFLASPNNPTGTLIPPDNIEAILRLGKLTVVDESYFEFSRSTCMPLLQKYSNLLILRGFKWAALAGHQIAYGLAAPEVVTRLQAGFQAEAISPMGIAAAIASLEDRGFLVENVRRLVFERERLFQALSRIPGVVPFVSQTNFLFCRFPGRSGKQVASALFKNGVKVRHYPAPEYRDGVRIRVGLPQESDRLLEALALTLNGDAHF
ncbi:MAG: aminotransferase class I/II-fold pyridoxal phosphate-dependent enzyme [Blastocatellia bacterium]|nr:aminotransferase class I/II-fold pyridoxal phosphate-dependent enzyme [Blastocatellia bacterium]